MMAMYTGKGVAPEAAHSGFETQSRRHQKSETGVSVTTKVDMCPPKIKKKTQKIFNCVYLRTVHWSFLSHHQRFGSITVERVTVAVHGVQKRCEVSRNKSKGTLKQTKTSNAVVIHAVHKV